jgi:hypothetical protein
MLSSRRVGSSGRRSRGLVVACLSVLVAGEVGSQPIPTVSLSASAARMGESGGSILVSAGLSSASAQDVRVPLSFLGTATQGVDYSVTASTIIIPAGATSASVTVSALDDPVDELSEKVNVRLGAVVNATKGSPDPGQFPDRRRRSRAEGFAVGLGHRPD